VSVTYSDTSPWPVAADGTGPSLELIDAEGELNDPANWRASQQNGGSPGNNGEPQAQAGDYDDNGAVEPQDHAVWRSQFGMTVSPGSGGDGNSNGTVDLADFVIWRKNVGAQAASAASLAKVAAPASAATAPKRASSADEAAARRIAGPSAFELPLRRAATAGSQFLDGAANAGVPIQQPAKTELNDLLLQIVDFDARRQADDLSPAIDDLEHGASTSPWAVDEAFQGFEFDIARSGDSFVSSLAGSRLS
jgi:hypothetical protein